MCTVVLLRRPGHAWPLVLGANRDEMAARPWRAPGRHWPDRPEVTAGLDELAGGSWLGLNDEGVLAAVMNREGALGPEAGRRSRGELVLEALDHADAAAAARALSALDAAAYRAFNLILADDRGAFWLKGTGGGRVAVAPVPEGVSMIASGELNDRAHPRIAAWLPSFEAAAAPDPAAGGWAAWETLMAAGPPAGAPGRAAMALPPREGYGTLSGALIALPAAGAARPAWRFCAARPGTAPWQDVAL